MSSFVNIVAHQGIHHKTIFEANMHVLAQWIMISLISLAVAIGLLWLLSRRETARETAKVKPINNKEHRKK